MKRKKWIPTAIAGALLLGFVVGSGRGGESLIVEVHPPASTAPLPPPVPPIPEPPFPPVEPPTDVPPPAPPFDPVPNDDRLGEYPAWNGVDLNCKDVGYAVRVPARDRHRLDRDGDGIGCDSYGPPRR